ncbi:MAG: NAD(P)-dependent oxidoreductase [Hyphomicrobiales bacterium]|nr:NAD(P)-dependent oxidoreductase [Hyphomicrobiales bacterium]
MSDLKISWIGLGKLGLPMAARIAATGRAVVGFDTDAGRAEAAASRQIQVKAEAREALDGAGLVFTSLPDDAVLESAMRVLAPSLAPGAIVVETSTVSAAASARAGEFVAAAGAAYLRAPVSGNPVLAERGELTVLASGPRAAFDAALPAMAAYSRVQRYLGEAEQARFAKLAINLMIAVSAGMMGEALAFARKGGVDFGDMLDLLADSAVGSPMVKYKAPPLKAGDYSSTFSCKQMAKDLDLLLDTARAASVPAPLAAQLRQTYSALIATGEGETDFIATVPFAARLAGL